MLKAADPKVRKVVRNVTSTGERDVSNSFNINCAQNLLNIIKLLTIGEYMS